MSDENDYDYEGQWEYIGDNYHFYVTNPRARPHVSYSMWMNTERGEFPVMSNTGGDNLLNSATHATDGRIAISDAESFVNAVGYSFHQCICFARLDAELIDETIESMYDDPCPDHERWAIHLIVSHLMGPKMFPEFEPFAEYANNCTEFGVPEYSQSKS